MQRRLFKKECLQVESASKFTIFSSIFLSMLTFVAWIGKFKSTEMDPWRCCHFNEPMTFFHLFTQLVVHITVLLVVTCIAQRKPHVYAWLSPIGLLSLLGVIIAQVFTVKTQTFQAFLFYSFALTWYQYLHHALLLQVNYWSSMVARILFLAISISFLDTIPFRYFEQERTVFLSVNSGLLVMVIEPVVYFLTRKNKLLILTNLLNEDKDKNTRRVLHEIDDCLLVLTENDLVDLFKNRAAYDLMSYERFEPLSLSPVESKEFRPLDKKGIDLVEAHAEQYFSMKQILTEPEMGCGSRFAIRKITPANMFDLSNAEERSVRIEFKRIKFDKQNCLLVHIRDIKAEMRNETLHEEIASLCTSRERLLETLSKHANMEEMSKQASRFCLGFVRYCCR